MFQFLCSFLMETVGIKQQKLQNCWFSSLTIRALYSSESSQIFSIKNLVKKLNSIISNLMLEMEDLLMHKSVRHIPVFQLNTLVRNNNKTKQIYCYKGFFSFLSSSPPFTLLPRICVLFLSKLLTLNPRMKIANLENIIITI